MNLRRSGTFFSRMEHGLHRVEADGSGFKVFWPSGPRVYNSARQTIMALVNGVEAPTGRCRDPKLTFDNYFKNRVNTGEELSISILDIIPKVKTKPNELVVSVPKRRIREENSLSVENRRGIDLNVNYMDVKRLFYAGFSRRVFAMGYDPEELFQELCKGLLIRNNGKCVFDPGVSSLGHYVHMVANCILSNYNRKYSRVRRSENVGYKDEDGEVVDLSCCDVPVESQQLSSIAASEMMDSIMERVPRLVKHSDSKMVRKATEMVTEGRIRSEIVAETGLPVSTVSKIIRAVRDTARV